MGLSPMPVWRPSLPAIIIALLIWAILLAVAWIGLQLFWSAIDGG
jgi:hypothetical protein